MADFSIALFDRLHDAGWLRLGTEWRGERVAIESFPTHAWRTLGFTPLAGKKRTTNIEPWQVWLEANYLGASLGQVTHDELQAVVAGLAGLQMLDGGRSLRAPAAHREGRLARGLHRQPAAERA
jgi:hypothetical protein